MITLFKIDNTGACRIWTVHVEENGIVVTHGILGGSQIEQRETITEGKASRNIAEQIESRVNSRVNKQIDKGYHTSVEKAQANINKNGMNMYAPMLAQRYDKVNLDRIDTVGAMVQRKLDGNRMLVTKSRGEIIAYTRNGKPIETMEHVTETLDFLEEGQTIDGEVYVHGMPLREVNSRMRRKQAGTKELNYHVYDTVIDDTYRVRHQALSAMPFEDSVILEPTWEYNSYTIKTEFSRVRKHGYEGLMLRTNTGGYAAGKRDKSLLKIKFRYDDEYPVIDVEEDKNGNGKFVFRLPNGKTFKAVAPGTHVMKRHVIENPEEYMGKIYTVSFAYLTDFGIPFHAVVEREYQPS